MFFGCSRLSQNDNNRLLVIAPDYLHKILDKAADQFREENGITVSIIYERSRNIISRTSDQPAADVFILGRREFGYRQTIDSMIIPGSFFCPFRMSLVLVGRTGGPDTDDIANLKDAAFKRIVIIDPQSSYEGELAREILEQKRLWDKLETKLIMARSVDQLYSFLSIGDADAAILFESSIHNRIGLEIMQRFDGELKNRLDQCAAVTSKSKNHKSAQAFVDFLSSSLCDIYKIRGIKQAAN